MTEVRNDMEFVMNVVSRVALAIDCDVGAYRRANFAEQSHQQTLILESERLLEAS
jgi:hypothetical protein